MSFRLRALVMVMLVVLTATAVTAWLSLDQAKTQIRESVAAGQAEITTITTELRTFGVTRGGWDGVGAAVSALADRTGQRIRVVDDSGTLLADSDVLAGKPARQTVGAPVLVDPRPVLRLPPSQFAAVPPRLTVGALQRYRSAVTYARCLAQAAVDVTVRTDDEGIPVVTSNQQSSCAPAPPTAADTGADSSAAFSCTAEQQIPCLQQVFARRADGFAPQRLQVSLGAVDQLPPPLDVAPAAAVALTVGIVAILAALLLSRTVLRPVRALTRAAHRLGGGDLSQRVPVSGRDEIAQLGHSFNRMAELLQESEGRQRRLVGDVAHELRTPLANVRGYLEAMRDGVVEPDPELIESLHEEVLLQQRIVEDLQDLTLAESGALTYHRTAVDVAELLRACQVAYGPSAERSGTKLTVSIVKAPVVLADPDRLRQVLGNLIVNAIRAASPGGAVLLTGAEAAGAVRIEISDTGKGIAREDLPHIFDRFWRADPARGRSTGGSGLGLAIVRQIVNDQDGQIAVTSTVGVGTTFIINFPRVI